MPNDKLIDNKSFQNLEEGKITFAGMVRGGFSEDTEFDSRNEKKGLTQNRGTLNKWNRPG